MSGIAGIAAKGKRILTEAMLRKISYRGKSEHAVLETPTATLGVVAHSNRRARFLVADSIGVQDYTDDEHFARATIVDGSLVLERDHMGIAPLYFCMTNDGDMCFASEIKALLHVSPDINEVPPGCRITARATERSFHLQEQNLLSASPREITGEIRKRLGSAISDHTNLAQAGVWLSGGLGSSAIAALARPCVETLHTFSTSLRGAHALDYAGQVAAFIKSEHHEIAVCFEELLSILPEVIYHCESFDTYLVRSGIINFLIARGSADYAQTVLSGEGANELFAGYAYLQSLSKEALSDELVDITRRMHNTTLQVLDRCAAAHGLSAHACFLNAPVLDYSLRVPLEYKIKDGIPQWILRESMAGLLPGNILKNCCLNFGKCDDIGTRLKEHAENTISTAEFDRERKLSNGWTLRNKEELMYYRIFKDHFGILPKLAWMGRTKYLQTNNPPEKCRNIESF